MKTKKMIDLNAHHYQKNSHQQYERAISAFSPNDFRRNAHVLDVGCGDGKITAEIAAFIPKGHILGIDASPSMVQLAKENFNIKHLEFQCMQAEDISTSASFDNILCFSCLLWIRNPKQVLDTLAKLLNPGGSLIILTYLKESSYVDILEHTLDCFPEYKQLSAAHTMLSLEEHRTILKSNNLQLQTFQVYDKVSSYTSEKDLNDYLEGWISSYVPIPKEQQQDFLSKAVRHCFESAKYQENDGIKLPYKALVIKAVKRESK